MFQPIALLAIAIGPAACDVSVCTSGTDGRPDVMCARLTREIAANPDQVFRVWVFFADKGAAADKDRLPALDARAAELSGSARTRRAHRRTAPGLVDERDLPLRRDYVEAVEKIGAKIRARSRWLNAVSVRASGATIRRLAVLPCVRRIHPVGRGIAASPIPIVAGDINRMPRISQRNGPPAWYGFSYNQLNQINVVAAHKSGYTGAGIIIGILDTGFDRSNDALNQGTPPAHPVNVVAEYDAINDDDYTGPEQGDPPDQATHGTLILGTLAAYQPNTLVGAAFDAGYVLAKTEIIDQEIPYEEDLYVIGLEFAESNGADVVTSSLGYSDWYTQADFDGQSAVTTIAVNTATDNGVVCCTAAGNFGHDASAATSHLIAPADAFAVLTCGAVDSSGNIASFSSDGPTADGRNKPELLARGIDTFTISPYMHDSIFLASGTSLSTPLLAGGAALVVQAHPTWSVDKVRRAFFHTAHDFVASSTYDALYIRGYGIADVWAAIQYVHSDINGDGVANGLDIPLFVAALQGVNGNAAQRRAADANADGAVNALDIPIFVGDLLGS